MHGIQRSGFAERLRRRLRRPSTLVVLGAGLLAADPLRHWVATWTDAPVGRVALLIALVLALAARVGARTSARRREAVAVLLPIASRPLCDRQLSRHRPHRGAFMRNRIVVFLLFVLALVLLPALLAHAAAPPGVAAPERGVRQSAARPMSARPPPAAPSADGRRAIAAR